MRTLEGKGKRTTLLALSVLLALLFLLAGGSKLFAPEMHFKDFRDSIWFVFVIGWIEVTGAALLLIPAIRFYGALLLAVDMLGATATHLKMNHFPVPLALCILCLLVAYLARGSAKAEEAG